MMDFPLTLTHFVERARTFFPKGEIVTALPDKTHCRKTYAEYSARTAKLANALTGKLGVKPGDRVATLAFNHQPPGISGRQHACVARAAIPAQ